MAEAFVPETGAICTRFRLGRSAHLEQRAAARALSSGDPQLDSESGFPLLLERLKSAANQRGLLALEAAVSEGRRAIRIRAAALAAEASLLPASAARWNEAIAEARTQLEAARRSAGRWQTLLNEGTSDAA